jgi:hypothetical protein
MLTDAQVAQYHDVGYVIPQQFAIGEEALEDLRARAILAWSKSTRNSVTIAAIFWPSTWLS